MLSLYCLLREPIPGQMNPWIAEVILKVPPQSAKNGVTRMLRTVTIRAKDELAAYTILVTQGV